MSDKSADESDLKDYDLLLDTSQLLYRLLAQHNDHRLAGLANRLRAVRRRYYDHCERLFDGSDDELLSENFPSPMDQH